MFSNALFMNLFYFEILKHGQNCFWKLFYVFKNKKIVLYIQKHVNFLTENKILFNNVF